MKKFLIIAVLLQGSLTFTKAQAPSYIPSNGLVAWYPFNGNANDESGNGNNGVVNGAALTADRSGNLNAAYSFNGSSNYIIVSGNSSLHNITDSMSCSIWILSTPFTPVKEISISKNQHLTGYGFYNTIYNNTNQCEFKVIDGSGSGGVYTTVPIITSSWHHIVSVVSGTDRYIYCDGVLNTSVPNGGYVYGANTGPLIIGAEESPAGILDQWYLGKLDDIGIWNRPLTVQEVTQIYNSTVGMHETDKTEFKVYPNPSLGIINIQANEVLLHSHYTITDLSGRLLRTGEVTAINMTVDLSDLKQGVYCFSVDDSKHPYSIELSVLN